MAIRKISALKVKTLVEPGRYSDGGGLYLQLRGEDRRSWVFRSQRFLVTVCEWSWRRGVLLFNLGT